MSDPRIPEHYAATRARIVAFVRSLPEGADDTPVPACPGWTVHDAVAHLVGITDDALAGNMAGVTTDPWTAAQVERGRGVPTAELLDRWERQGPMIEPFLGDRPTALIDCVTHEHDVYGAFGAGLERDSVSLAVAAELVGATSFDTFRARLGRRSPAQITALGMDLSAVVFGPRELDLVE